VFLGEENKILPVSGAAFTDGTTRPVKSKVIVKKARIFKRIIDQPLLIEFFN